MISGKKIVKRNRGKLFNNRRKIREKSKVCVSRASPKPFTIREKIRQKEGVHNIGIKMKSTNVMDIVESIVDGCRMNAWAVPQIKKGRLLLLLWPKIFEKIGIFGIRF